jgi:hypothetical protein
MSRKPTLTVVGGKAAEPDAELVELIARNAERQAEAAKDPDGLIWQLTVVNGEVSVSFHGGKLETAALAEVVAGDMKCAALGLE